MRVLRQAVQLGRPLPAGVGLPTRPVGRHPAAGTAGRRDEARGRRPPAGRGARGLPARRLAGVVAIGSTAWDRRPNETATQYNRFVEYRELPRHERARHLLKMGGTPRAMARVNEWAVRVAAYDDQVDRDYEQARLEHVREVREFHAKAGRALLSFAIGRINKMAEASWRPGDLVKLADLARKMEMAAVVGAEHEITAVSHTAMVAAGADVDEWDRLAADLAGTVPAPVTTASPPGGDARGRRTPRPGGRSFCRVLGALGTPPHPWQADVADVLLEYRPNGSYRYGTAGICADRQAGKTRWALGRIGMQLMQPRQLVIYLSYDRSAGRIKWAERGRRGDGAPTAAAVAGRGRDTARGCELPRRAGLPGPVGDCREPAGVHVRAQRVALPALDAVRSRRPVPVGRPGPAGRGVQLRGHAGAGCHPADPGDPADGPVPGVLLRRHRRIRSPATLPGLRSCRGRGRPGCRRAGRVGRRARLVRVDPEPDRGYDDPAARARGTARRLGTPGGPAWKRRPDAAKTLPLDIFRREWLNITSEDLYIPLVQPESWATCRSDDPIIGEPTLAISVNADRDKATLAAAGLCLVGDMDRCAVEVIATSHDVEWIVGQALEIAERQAARVVIHDRAPAGARASLAARRGVNVRPRTLRGGRGGGRRVRRRRRRERRPPERPPSTDDATAGAIGREVGEAWTQAPSLRGRYRPRRTRSPWPGGEPCRP